MLNSLDHAFSAQTYCYLCVILQHFVRKYRYCFCTRPLHLTIHCLDVIVVIRVAQMFTAIFRVMN